VTALRAARRLSIAVDALFSHAEAMPDLSEEQLDALARDYFDSALREDERQRATAAPGRALYTDARALALPPVEADQFVLSEILDGIREELADRDFRRIAPEVDHLLAQSGVEAARDDEIFRLLAQRLLRADIEVLRLAYHRRAGDYRVTPRDRLFLERPPTRPLQRPPAASPRLSDVAAAFICAKERDGNWKPITKKNSEPKLKLFVELVGDKPIDELTRDDVRDWRDALSDMGLESSTIQQHFKVVSGLFIWAKREGKATIANPTEGLAPKGKQGTRKAYQPDDLKRLFQSPLFTGHSQTNIRTQPGRFLVKDYKFWFPLIALHSGLRVEEIAKLKVRDLRPIEDVWCFDIYETKTEAGDRLVPVHPRLIALEFLDYTKLQKDSLWPEIRPGTSGKFSQGFVQWWAGFRHRSGLDQEGLVFHSFRHTFAAALQKAGVQEATVALLMGHRHPNITFGRYASGKLMTPKEKLELIENVDFGVDLTHLLENSAERRTAPGHRGATAPAPTK
jgi:integrase